MMLQATSYLSTTSDDNKPFLAEPSIEASDGDNTNNTRIASLK